MKLSDYFNQGGPDRKTRAERIARLRDVAGCSASHFSRVIRGQKRLSYEKAVAVSAATGGAVTVADLMTGSGS